MAHDADHQPVKGGMVNGPGRTAPPSTGASRAYMGGSAADETLVEGESARGTLNVRAGDKIGRYVAIEKLGAGGMGVVWAAYDPELDRRVAVKLLRPDGRSEKKREVARVRLQREAQAMAKLSHPNVVAVHDVGDHEGQIFVAMAHLGGGTLKSHLDAKSWDWEETLRICCQAGEGLAAAHEAGLVHRDFKPDNVILDERRRPKVVDFGLVRATDSVSDLDPVEEVADTYTSGALSTSVTHVGAVMGTPAYMAPEQHMGREATPLSDQFSFCVTLYEAMYGRTPFPASSLMGLAQRVLSGEVEAPPSDAPVTAQVREAILRGLSPEPGKRFANMSELLAELRDDREAHKRRWLGGLGLGLMGLAVLIFGLREGQEAPPTCTGGEDQMRAVFGGEQREAMRTAFGQSELPYAADTQARVSQRLEQWSKDWTTGHREACEATELHKHQSAELMDKRMACLSGQLREFDARVEVLVAATDEDIARAVDIIDELPSPSVCADTETLIKEKTRVEGPEAPAIKSRLAQAEAARTAHHFDDAAEHSQAALELAREHSERALEAKAIRSLAFTAQQRSQPEQAAEQFEIAGWLAVELDEPETATGAWLHLADVVGDDLGRDKEWPRWERAARASLARVTDPRSTLDIQLENALGGIDERNGRNREALVHYETAFASAEAKKAQNTNIYLHLLNNIGIVYLNLGETDKALERLSLARDKYIEHYGAQHPNVAAALGNLGNAQEVTGDYAAAIESQREALRLSIANFPEGHIDIAAAHDNLGNALDGAGQTETAIEHMREALKIRKARMGGKDPSVGISSNNLGDALMRLGRMDEAVPHVELACELFESGYGEDHPHTGICFNNLARVRHHLGRSHEALVILERALEIHRGAFGETHPILAYHYVERGRILRDLGRRGDALEALELGLKLRDEGDEEGMTIAEACFELAKTLPKGQRIRAKSLAERAAGLFREAGDAGKKDLARVDAWLAKLD